MIEVENLSFSYGKHKVLKDVSFKVNNGDVVSILGPNGVGKTTLMKCMCNIHKPSSGSVTVNGQDVLSLSGKDLAKNIAFVPQSVPRTKNLVYDSVLMGRKPYINIGVTENDLDITSRAVRDLGLEDLAFKYVDRISGGEFQKVQIARALAQESSVVMLDEPTNNMDVCNQHLTMDIASNMARGTDACVIMTMHDINLSLYYSDTLMFMKGGEIIAFGGKDIVTPDLIYEVYGMEVDVIRHKNIPLIVPGETVTGLAARRHMETHSHPHDATDHIFNIEDC
ncbi:MAG: ABC transporter ATP-binding protein [Candidatus Methanomethylophilaceae archaeon]|jgi:iron complex transport system ATP-binding protein